LTLATRLSQTEKYYALELLDDVGSVEIWIGDVGRGTRSRLSKFDSDCWGVQFSTDGHEVAFCVQIADGGRLYRQEITGARDPEAILDFSESERIMDIAQWPRPDLILVEALARDLSQRGIRAINPETGEIRDVLMDDYAQGSPALSPDGNWLAYESQESGRQEVYVRAWPDLDRKWRVSREGGSGPRWNRTGNRLQFIAGSAPEVREVSFDVAAGDPDVGLPRVAVTLPPNHMGVEIAPDLDRYLIGFVPRIDQLPSARVLVGWGANAR
jgi:Tol biopolymer transport system component